VGEDEMNASWSTWLQYQRSMNKQEILGKLIANHRSFIHGLKPLSEQEFLFAPEGKWNAGQQLDHIYRSVKPLNQALMLPPFVIRLLFGKANRPSRTYEELVSRYRQKLESGGTAPGRFVPQGTSYEGRIALAGSMMAAVEGVAKKAGRFSESNWDELILPHPLLGKVTLREMLYFTIYHVEHHGTLVRNYLGGRA
jgi:hypothetical protein